MQEPPADYTVDGVVPTFSALPHAVLFDNELSRDARLLYAMLQSHWWQGGECWASHATLAAQIGCKERMLRYYLRELIAAGYVTERRRGRGQAKAYAPSQAARDCQLNRQESAALGSKRQPVASQLATGCQFKRQEIANRRRSSEEDPPEEEHLESVAHAPRKPRGVSHERRASRLPDDWSLTDAHYEAATREGLDRTRAAAEGAKFADHFRANGKRMIDWMAAWRNWVRRSAEFSAPRRPSPNGTYRSGPAPEPISDEMRERIDARAKRTPSEVLAAARARKEQQP